MVQKYDFVVTSGGIGPTHDGMYADLIDFGVFIFPVLSLTRTTFMCLLQTSHMPLWQRLSTSRLYTMQRLSDVWMN